jgi:hypothetical protein
LCRGRTITERRPEHGQIHHGLQTSAGFPFARRAFVRGCARHGHQQRGKVRWIARYTFTKTGRPVENHVASEFEFKDGKILRQVDRFPFWRWSHMALGLPGTLLGWSSVIRNAVRREAARSLAAFRATP